MGHALGGHLLRQRTKIAAKFRLALRARDQPERDLGESIGAVDDVAVGLGPVLHALDEAGEGLAHRGQSGLRDVMALRQSEKPLLEGSLMEIERDAFLLLRLARRVA